MTEAQPLATVTVAGHCLCGAVTFAAQVYPHVHVCHCGMCRRSCGGPAFALRTESIEFAGDASQLARYDSSKWAMRGFCKTCGSSLFYELREGGHTALFAGALDADSAAAAGLFLHGEIFVDDKPSFYDFAGDHERLTGKQFTDRVMGAN